MAVSYIAFSGIAQGSNPLTPAMPGTVNTGDGVLLSVILKPDNSSIATPAGWTLIADVAGGGGSFANGTGPTRQYWFFREKDANWSSIPTLSVTGYNTGGATALRVTKAAGTTWDIAASTGVYGTAAATNNGAATMGSNPGITSGDLLIVGYSNQDEAPTWSAQSVAASGATIGAATEITEAFEGTAGFDFGGMLAWAAVTGGTASANPTTAATLTGATGRGTVVLVRVREVTITDKSGTESTAISVSESTDKQTFDATLPGPISGIEPEAGGSWAGPHMDSNGNLYRVTEEQLGAGGAGFGNHPRMEKSTNGGISWTRMDAANGPGYGLGGSYNDMESAWTIYNPVNKEIVLLYMKSSSRWWGVSYRTSDHPTNPDTWDTSTFATSSGQGGNIPATIASESGVAASVLSDGRVRGFIRGQLQSGFESFLHAERSAAKVWNAGTYITDGVNMTRPSAVTGSSDVTYLFYRDHTNGRVRYRTITSAGTVNASARVDTNGAGAGAAAAYENNVVPPVYYSDGGTDVAVVGFVNASNVLRTVEVRGGVVGSEQVVSTDTVIVDPNHLGGSGVDSQGPAAALAVVGTTLYALWGDNTSGDVYYATRANGGSWSARTLLADTGSGNQAQYIYANTIVRANGDTLIAYTYDVGPHGSDAGNIQYNELFVSGGSTPVVGTETTAITVTDTSSLEISDTKSATDTAAITVTETSDLLKTMVASDTAAISATDASDTMVKSTTSTDQAALAVIDTSAATVTLSAADTTAITITDVGNVGSTLPATDSAAIGLADASSTFSTGTASDTTAISVTDTSVVQVTLSATDTTALSVGDNSSVLVSDAKSTTDTTALTVTDSGTVAVSSTSTDTAAITANEATSQFVTLSATDSVALTVNDTSEQFVTLGGAGVIVFDSFDRLDDATSLGISDSGHTWVNRVATFGTIGNQAYSSSANPEAIATINIGTHSDIVVSAVWAGGTAANSDMGVVGRYTNNSNFYLAQVVGTGTVRLWKRVGAAWIQLGTDVAGGIIIGQTISLKCEGTTISALVNGVAVRTVTDSAFATGTDVGLRKGDVGIVRRWDDFSVTTGGVVGNDSAAISLSDTSTSFKDIVASDTAAISVADSGIVYQGDDLPASDSASIQITESSALFKTMVATDTSAVSVTDTAATSVAMSATDATAISVGDVTNNLARPVVASDAAAITVTETASGISLNVTTDFASLAVSETATVVVFVSRTDTASIAVADTSASALSSARADTTALGVIDVSQVAVTISATDTAALSVSEATSGTNTVTATDQTAITLTDVSASFRTLSATDAAAISVADTSASFKTLSATDSTLVSVDETTSLVKAVVAIDSIAITLVELSNIASTLPGQDSSTLGIVDTSSVSVAQPTADTSSISVTETASILVSISTTDTASLSVAETATNFLAKSANDTAALTITEAPGVVSGVNALARTDTAAITVTESRAVLIQVSANDQAALSVYEISAGSNTQSASDTASITVTESTVTAVSLSRSDTSALSVNDQASVTGINNLSATDTASIGVTETRVTNVSLTRTDTSALSVSEATNYLGSTPGSDQLTIGLTENAVIFTTKSAADSATISVSDVGSRTSDATTLGTDTAALAVSENAVVVVSVQSTDTGALSLTETSAQTKARPAADAAGVSVSETRTILVLVSATDSASISLSEGYGAVPTYGTDTLTIGLTETSSVFAADVYRTYVFVYLDGQWVEGRAMMWKNGAWRPAPVYAYTGDGWVDDTH